MSCIYEFFAVNIAERMKPLLKCEHSLTFFSEDSEKALSVIGDTPSEKLQQYIIPAELSLITFFSDVSVKLCQCISSISFRASWKPGWK